MKKIYEDLLLEIKEKLEYDCENGFDNHASRYLPGRGGWDNYSHEEKMIKGDSHAWELIQKIENLLEFYDVEK